MNTVFVVANDGTKLMPTDIKHARKLMKKHKAVIFKHQPLTIKLTHDSEHNVQPIEFKEDTGDHYVGVSLCSEKHEFVSAEYKLLHDEPERHNDCRKYRRTRRNRKRYRKDRFNNRRMHEGWLAPSVRHKKDAHIQIFKMYNDVLQITNAVFEVGSFDTHALREYEEHGVVITGTDYQRGERYGYETLKLAVLHKQGYICPVCGKSLIGCRIALHHKGYLKQDRSNRLSNLAAVHDYEHTSANHQKGGALYKLKPDTKSYAGAAFMNTVRWYIVNEMKKLFPDVKTAHTYGAETALHRKDLKVKKSHANDAYAMGNLNPKHRSKTRYYKKRRRNNRILSKFYDTKYIDIRTGETAKGSALGCNRTKRSVPRNNSEDLRMFRGKKLLSGRTAVRNKRYVYQPGDVVIVNRKKRIVHGMHNGINIEFEKDGLSPKSAFVKKVKPTRKEAGWHFFTTQA